jgi:hypothetical protein
MVEYIFFGKTGFNPKAVKEIIIYEKLAIDGKKR